MLNFLSNPLTLLISIIGILIAITIHEFSHAFMADKLGDPTPRFQGRLSLNPLVHIDPIGLLLVFLAGFGWGKPVQFDPFNLRDPRKDAALISIAGPISNFSLALLLALVLRLLLAGKMLHFGDLSFDFLRGIIDLNIALGVFNLVPIHPLDGFKIVGGLLSREQSKSWYSLERYGLIFLLLLILPIAGHSMVESIISPVISFFDRLLVGSAIF